MERLTYETDGRYVNTLIEQAPPYALNCDIDTAVTRLAHYEDLQEHGRLLELPCAVGDTVYVIYPNDLEDNILEKIAVGFSNKAMMLYGLLYWTPFSEIGKTIFLTKEEAKEALKRMEDGK